MSQFVLSDDAVSQVKADTYPNKGTWFFVLTSMSRAANVVAVNREYAKAQELAKLDAQRCVRVGRVAGDGYALYAVTI